MRRLRALFSASLALLVATPAAALATTSHVKFWQALGNNVSCGVAIHPPARPATQVLCSGRAIPAPAAGVGFGDPGFVFIGAHGRPRLARLSQDSFEGSAPAALAAGTSWSRLGITCRISPTRLRCANGAGHGFTLGRHYYKAF